MCSDDTFIKVWDAYNQWSQVRNFSFASVSYNGPVKALQFINETTLIGGYTSGYAVIWSITTGLNLKAINVGQGHGVLKALSRVFYACLMAAGVYKRIFIFSICDYTINYELPNTHSDAVNDFELAYHNYYGAMLISSSLDSEIRIWSVDGTSGTLQFTLTGHADKVFGLKMITSSVLASASFDNTIKLWDISGLFNVVLIQTLVGHTFFILYGLDLIDSATLISASGDMTMKLWSTTSRSLLQSAKITCTPYVLAIVPPKIGFCLEIFFFFKKSLYPIITNHLIKPIMMIFIKL